MAIIKDGNYLNKVIVMALSVSMLFTGCTADSGKDDNDDEENATSETEIMTSDTEESPEISSDTSEETSQESPVSSEETTVPLPSQEEVDQAYLEVLRQYGDNIRLYETDYHPHYSGVVPSINYTDIDGDGINELVFKYVSDSLYSDEVDFSMLEGPVFANVAVYDYNIESGAAECILDAMTESRTGAWELTEDVSLLDDGGIIFTNMNGRMGFYTQSIIEYQYNGTGYDVANTWQVDEEIPEEVMQSGTEDYSFVSTSAYCNDNEVTPDDFYAAQQDYISRLSIPLMPCSMRDPGEGYNAQDLFGRDWGAVPGSFFASGTYTSYNELVSSLDPEYAELLASSVNMNEAYKAILEQYEPALRMLENTEYFPVRSCSYLDITGDGMPELIIQYGTDGEGNMVTEGEYYIFADLAFYTYDPAAGSAVLMLHVPNTIINAGGGFITDSVLLDNGHIIVTTGWGDEDSEYNIQEYELQGNAFVPVNSLFNGNYLHEDDDNYSYESVFEWNGEAISEEDYNSHRSDYVNGFNSVITRSAYYDAEWYTPDEWGGRILSIPDYSMFYDEMYGMLQ